MSHEISHRAASVMRAYTGVPAQRLARTQRAQDRYLAMVERAGVWLSAEMMDIWGEEAVNQATRTASADAAAETGA